jgi:hypothetical protein
MVQMWDFFLYALCGIAFYYVSRVEMPVRKSMAAGAAAFVIAFPTSVISFVALVYTLGFLFLILFVIFSILLKIKLLAIAKIISSIMSFVFSFLIIVFPFYLPPFKLAGVIFFFLGVFFVLIFYSTFLEYYEKISKFLFAIMIKLRTFADNIRMRRNPILNTLAFAFEGIIVSGITIYGMSAFFTNIGSGDDNLLKMIFRYLFYAWIFIFQYRAYWYGTQSNSGKPEFEIPFPEILRLPPH